MSNRSQKRMKVLKTTSGIRTTVTADWLGLKIKIPISDRKMGLFMPGAL